MGIKSKIYIEEAVENTERIFGSAGAYQPVILVYPDGREEKAMYTIKNIESGIETASKNPEDWPEDVSFWDKLFQG